MAAIGNGRSAVSVRASSVGPMASRGGSGAAGRGAGLTVYVATYYLIPESFLPCERLLLDTMLPGQARNGNGYITLLNDRIRQAASRQSGILVDVAAIGELVRDSRYLGLATGMNSLIRPALYGAYHEIVNLTRLDEPAEHVFTVVGPICESGDVLGESRFLPESREGDIILIANTGAYGRVMSSHYNRRSPAEEIVV